MIISFPFRTLSTEIFIPIFDFSRIDTIKQYLSMNKNINFLPHPYKYGGGLTKL